MYYISGPLAFCVPCELDSPGEWRISPETFKDENINAAMRDSEKSPFKEYGIEKDKYIQYHPICLYNVANHVRAYLDMLYEKRFDEMENLFRKYIDNGKCRREIFDQVYFRLKGTAEFHDVNTFMAKEFGNAWFSYLDAIKRASSHLAKQMEKNMDFFKDVPDGPPDINNLLANTKKSNLDLTNADIAGIMNSTGRESLLKVFGRRKSKDEQVEN